MTRRCSCCTLALRCVACMSFEPVREDMPDWQDDEVDTRPAERAPAGPALPEALRCGSAPELSATAAKPLNGGKP
jgi:hypothetical protein